MPAIVMTASWSRVWLGANSWLSSMTRRAVVPTLRIFPSGDGTWSFPLPP